MRNGSCKKRRFDANHAQDDSGEIDRGDIYFYFISLAVFISNRLLVDCTIATLLLSISKVVAMIVSHCIKFDCDGK